MHRTSFYNSIIHNYVVITPQRQQNIISVKINRNLVTSLKQKVKLQLLILSPNPMAMAIHCCQVLFVIRQTLVRIARLYQTLQRRWIGKSQLKYSHISSNQKDAPGPTASLKTKLQQ